MRGSLYILLASIGILFSAEKPNIYENASDKNSTIEFRKDGTVEIISFQYYTPSLKGGAHLEKLEKPIKNVSVCRVHWQKREDDSYLVFLYSYSTSPARFRASLERRKSMGQEAKELPEGLLNIYTCKDGRLTVFDGSQVFKYRK